MAALEPGRLAPDVQLPANNGSTFSLAAARQNGPVVLAFFKISCPTCQLTFPYLDRIHKAYRDHGYTLVGISQDSPEDTDAFARRFGVTFTLARDTGAKYVASNAYGITNVPSIFVVGRDGTVEMTSVGWSREEIEMINQRLALASGQAPIALVRPEDSVPDFKPG